MSSDSILRSHCRTIVSRELASYDHLSTPSRIVYEHKSADYVPSFIEQGIYRCAHGTMLNEPCTKCGRDADDCKAYAVSLQAKLQELLALLPSQSTEVKS